MQETLALESPLVSVVITSDNDARFVAGAIEGVLTQSALARRPDGAA
jgi:hypothetical protein